MYEEKNGVFFTNCRYYTSQICQNLWRQKFVNCRIESTNLLAEDKIPSIGDTGRKSISSAITEKKQI